VKKISLNSASPVIWRSGLTSTPGLFISTMRYVRPSCFSLAVVLRPRRMHRSAICA